MAHITTLETLSKRIIRCKKCPRLVIWRERIAKEKVLRYCNEKYWGKPVPGWDDENAELLIIGLAPAAHGANRTGRMFTGDRSGNWLYKTLYKFKFSNQLASYNKNDGLKLNNCWITVVLRCAPPQNIPTKPEIMNCRKFLIEEISLLKNVKVIIALGKIAFDNITKIMKESGLLESNSNIKFSHGTSVQTKNGIFIIASYHPSQQNTFTGKLTMKMFYNIFKKANEILGFKHESRI